MAGRTIGRYGRLYVNGYDWSGYAEQVGTAGVDYSTDHRAALSDPVKGALLGASEISFGPVNALFDTTGHARMNAVSGSSAVILYAVGDRAAPALGVPAFATQLVVTSYQATPESNGFVTTTAEFGGVPADAGILYSKPWGVLLHPAGNETAVNSGAGYDAGAATALGGYMVYQLLGVTGTGNVTIKVQDSADGTTWADITGATSGAIADTAAPTAGVVQLAVTATVRRYLRWQIVLSGATGATFALAFVRG